MNVWRIGTAVVDGHATPVVAHDGGLTRLSTVLGPGAPRTVQQLLQLGPGPAARIGASVRAGLGPDVDGEPVWAPPIMPAKVICIGANYAEHNREMLGEVASEYPFAFLKPPTTSLLGGGRPAELPGHAEHIDYEAELAVVIGAAARNVGRHEALAHVFGYAPFNDLSARDWVGSPTVLGLDWVMGKAFDGSAPMGPLITPAPFVPDPDDLSIRLWVNGDLRQDSRTSQMVFDVASLVAHLSSVMTLEPGDVIATGTPSGVGMGASPPAWLRAGDEVRVAVECLGPPLVTRLSAADTGAAGAVDGPVAQAGHRNAPGPADAPATPPPASSSRLAPTGP